MAFNLLDAVRGYLTPNLVERGSSYLGESPTGINKALNAAVPAVLATFVNRAERGDAQGLLNDAAEAADSNVLSNPQSLLSGDVSSFLSSSLGQIQGMLGNNFGHIVSSIANYAGIKSSAAQGLMGMIVPVGLATLGRHTRETNMSARELSSYLSNQKASIMNALPAGLALDLFEDRPRTGRVTTVTSDTPHATRMETVPERRKTNLMPWVLAGLAAIALIWFLARNRDETNMERTTARTNITTTDTSAAKATMPVNDASRRVSTKVRLVNGVEINAYKGGVEDRLVACLNDASCTPGKEQWFDFDNINFEMGSARLTPASQEQVQNIVAILKAYPDAEIKIGGYTDKTGDATANKTLSQQRADAVMIAIRSAGADADQLVGAEGYGSAFAKVPATASDEERRQDRRIAVQLRDK